MCVYTYIKKKKYYVCDSLINFTYIDLYIIYYIVHNNIYYVLHVKYLYILYLRPTPTKG